MPWLLQAGPCMLACTRARRIQSGTGSRGAMSVILIILGAIAVAWILAYHRLPAVVWTVVFALFLGAVTAWMRWPQPVIATLWVVLIAMALLLNPTPLRRALVSRPLLGLFRKILPQMS